MSAAIIFPMMVSMFKPQMKNEQAVRKLLVVFKVILGAWTLAIAMIIGAIGIAAAHNMDITIFPVSDIISASILIIVGSTSIGTPLAMHYWLRSMDSPNSAEYTNDRV